MNTIFSICDKRQAFWQWDLNRKLVVFDDACDEVHFAAQKDGCALVCKVYTQGDKRLVDVPNILLQGYGSLIVFAYARDEHGDRTTHSAVFNVIPRAKPDDYVYTETEVLTWKALDERVKKLENPDPGGNGVNPEYIGELVEDYLTKNPPASGKDGVDGKDGADGAPGADGKDGITPEFSIGEVETLPAGSEATASITGTKENPILNLGIPKGEDGKDGEGGGGSVDIPEALPNPHKLTFTGAVNAEYDGSEALEVNIPEGGSGGIPVPETAEVGQTIVVKAVDENGKPTEWEAVDLPSGGGAEWKLIGSVTTEEEASGVSIKSDTIMNELLVYYSVPPIAEDTGGSTYAYPMILNENGVMQTINANVAITKPNTKTHRCIWHLTPTFATRQYQDNSGATPSTLVGTTESVMRTIAKAYKGGGGLIGFQLHWNLSNKFPAGVILEVWGR